jgi:thermitase
MVYSIAFIGAVASLAAWFFHRANDSKSSFLQLTFFAALTLFVLTVLVQDVSFSDKLGVLFRDLGIMAAFGLFFQLLSANKRLFFYGSIAATLIFGAYHHFFMAKSFIATEDNSITYDASGELLLELAEHTSTDVLATVVRKYELSLSPAFSPASPEATELDDYYLVDIPSSHHNEVETIMRALQAVAEVDWVEPNETISINPIAGKEEKINKKKFGINDPGLEQLWGFESMEVDKLYNFLDNNSIKARKKALIAILDTGVDAKHEDLKDNFRSLDTKSDDDPRGHGTHCAGIAAAVSNNAVGVASFSRNNQFVQVSSIKVLSASGIGTQKMIIDGIIKAADAKADVISLSLGGRSNQSKERAYQKAVDYANNKGAIVVVAAGNSNRNAKDFAPAGVPGVITVSALNEQLSRAVFSNYVTDLDMGIAAPGVNIYSTVPDGKYATFSGTSMATPYVSGLVGLLKSIDPSLNTKDTYQILMQSGKKTRNTTETGYCIQPFEAVRQLTKNRSL